MSDGRSLTARCAFAAAVASCLIALRLITLSAAGTFFVGNGAAALTALDTPYVQTFDSLASAGTSTSLPVGWAFWESGSSAAANGLYAAGTGSGNAGDVYSFGSAGGTDRAFGTLLSGTLTPIVGGSFTNSTGAAIGTVTIAYTGEQWRLGTAGRADRLDFQYSLNAVDLTSGAWVDVNALDFSSPTTVGSVGALNGNLAANRR